MIGFAGVNDVAAIQAFLDRYWKRNYLLARDTRFFLWQFRSRHAERVNFVLSRDGEGELDGILGFIPTDHHDVEDTARTPFLWLVNWMVKPGSGRPALGIMLRRYLERNLDHVGLGTIGLNRETLDLYRPFRFVTGQMDHHVLPNPTLKEFSLLGECAPFGVRRVPLPVSGSGDIRELAAAEMQGVVRPDPTCFAKGAEYYRRRYLAHPIYRYHCLQLSLGRRSLLLFVRRSEAAGSSCLRIVECAGDFRLLEDMADALREYVAAEGAEYIDLVSRNVLPARQTGSWMDARTLAAPTYFEPYQAGFVGLLYAFRMKDGDVNPRLFRGDCDQDAPRRLR